MGKCNALNCYKSTYANGYCATHFRRIVKYGQLMCLMPGCDADMYTGGYCKHHYKKRPISNEATKEVTFFIKVGYNIAKARLNKGLNQQELSEKAGITTSTLGQYERAQVKINLHKLVKIAYALELDITELLEGAEI